MFKRIKSKLLSLYGLFIFRKKIRVYGLFKVGNKKNIKIGNNCAINLGVYILGHHEVCIGNNVVLSAKCMLLDAGLDLSHFLTSNDFLHTKKTIIIQDNVWIGAGSVVLPGVTVGHHSVVGAGSVVTKDVSPYSVIAGNPAKLIKKLSLKGSVT